MSAMLNLGDGGRVRQREREREDIGWYIMDIFTM